MTAATRIVMSPRRVTRVGAGAIYMAVAAATAAIVHAAPASALAGSRVTLTAELAAGAMLVAAAFTVPPRPGAHLPALLAATGIALPLAEWNAPGAGAALSIGLMMWAAWPPLLAAAALRGPEEQPLGRARAAVIALAAATGVGVLGAAGAATFDPVAQGCVQCPANHLLLAGDTSTWIALSRTGFALTVVWTATVATMLAVRLARATPAVRRIAAPVLAPIAAALIFYGAQAAHALRRGFLSNDPTDRRLWSAQVAAIMLTAAGVAAARVYRRHTRAALARLVLELGASPSPGDLRDRLAHTIGDPELQLLHRREDGTGWIDDEGCDTEPRADRETTRVLAQGSLISALVHRPGLLADPALGAEIARAARLAFEHERLHALHHAHLTQLRASRTRLVATADNERQRLERDLHDGAQQRLVTLAINIRLARRQHPALDAALAPAEEELRAAVAELRDLARGLYPAVLAEDGLAAALEALAEDDPRLTLGQLSERRCSQAVESAAYFFVAETLRHGNVAVETRTLDDRLLVDARGTVPLSTRIQDRVAAAGGTFAADAGRLQAELPCAS